MIILLYTANAIVAQIREITRLLDSFLRDSPEKFCISQQILGEKRKNREVLRYNGKDCWSGMRTKEKKWNWI